MQDIDFSRYYRKDRRTFATKEQPASRSGKMPVNKVSLYLAIAFSALAIGFIGGTQLQKKKMIREIESQVAPDSIATANVATPTSEEAAETVRTTLSTDVKETQSATKSVGGSYLILAKIYPDEKEASLAGLNLKRDGLKAFMARNGKKIKLYVGPIEGKSEAYSVLGKLKKSSEFSGAILYRK